MTDEEYIIQRVEDQIQWYSKKSQINQKCYKWFKRFELILSGSIPVVTAGLWSCYYGKLIVAALGAIVALLAAWQNTFRYYELWKSYRQTAEMLKHEKFLYITRTSPYDDPGYAFGEFVKRIESITLEENRIWKDFSGKNRM